MATHGSEAGDMITGTAWLPFGAGDDVIFGQRGDDWVDSLDGVDVDALDGGHRPAVLQPSPLRRAEPPLSLVGVSTGSSISEPSWAEGRADRWQSPLRR